MLCLVLLGTQLAGCSFTGKNEDKKISDKVAPIVSGMTLDEKISQMIIPAIRTWNGEAVTDLSACPELKQVLQKHQYGGIILFGANISGTEQTARLIFDLQKNNNEIGNATTHIPYFLPVDQEGGIVTRLISGTRMTGSMAIGATGKNAPANAEATGQIIGEELAALGFNMDYAPDIDVNNNPEDPVIGTRAFSDDPETVASLGSAYAEGLRKSGIIPTFKHFPGHGDTSVDSHIGTPSVEKTYEEINANELIPFRAAIQNGAEMIMTAHITFPLIDEEQVYGDGVTKGFFPATMSKKIITDLLRDDMGFNGVVVTDALEMDAIRTAKLVPGEEDSTAYSVNIAEKVILAGVDMLLLPLDLTNDSAAEFYDDYIAGLAALVENGTIPEARINESVTRILKLKAKYGLLDEGYVAADAEAVVVQAVKTVGSQAHHKEESDIARQAITLLKNENHTLPLTHDAAKVVIFGRQASDLNMITRAVDQLRENGTIAPETEITLDYYYDSSAAEDSRIHLTKETKAGIADADAVVALCYTSGNALLNKTAPQYAAIADIIALTHAGNGTFTLLSTNLPYDAARFVEADAIVCAYSSAGSGVDPTARAEGSGNAGAYNPNVPAALGAIFGAAEMTGKLPVNIPVIEENAEGLWQFGKDFLYTRGFSASGK